MGAKLKTRDFTSQTIDEFDRYMDSYYDEQTDKIKSFWNRIVNWLGFFDLPWFNANGESEKYVRSLSSRRKKAETAITKTWTAVADVEATYEAYFNERLDLCASYSNIVRTIKNRITISAFQQSTNWGALLSSCAEDYTKFLENKALEITNKPVDELTDADIEILAYVALTTQDNELKEKIYNTFYYESTQNHIDYANAKPDDPYYRYYDRSDEKWEKFVDCTEVFFANKYQAYYNGELSEEEINSVIRNKLLVEYMDETGNVLFCEGSTQPIHFSSSGTVSLTTPTHDHVVVWYNTSPANKGPFSDKESISAGGQKHTYNSNPAIADGADASRDIAVDVSDGMYVERRLDWKDVGKKVGTAVVDHFIPGSGKIIGNIDKSLKKVTKVKDIAEKGEEINSEYYEKDHFYEDSKPSYQWFVNAFDIKCVTTENGYTLYPTKDTEQIVTKMLKWLQDHGYSDIYNSCTARACYDVEMTDTEWFVANVNVVDLYNNLDGAGILEQLSDEVFRGTA